MALRTVSRNSSPCPKLHLFQAGLQQTHCAHRVQKEHGAIQPVEAFFQGRWRLKVDAAHQESNKAVLTQAGRPRVVVDVSDAPVVPILPNAMAAAEGLFAALNDRDVSAVLAQLTEDVFYEDLASSTTLRGRAAVGRFFLEALAALPDEAMFVLMGPDGEPYDPRDDGIPAASPVLQAGVAWHLELRGLAVPLSRGVGVYWADLATGQLARIWNNPEHTLKQPAPGGLSAAASPWASPLLRGLGPLVLPAARGVSSLFSALAPVAVAADTSTVSNRPVGGDLLASLSASSLLPFTQQQQSPTAGRNTTREAFDRDTASSDNRTYLGRSASGPTRSSEAATRSASVAISTSSVGSSTVDGAVHVARSSNSGVGGAIRMRVLPSPGSPAPRSSSLAGSASTSSRDAAGMVPPVAAASSRASSPRLVTMTARSTGADDGGGGEGRSGGWGGASGILGSVGVGSFASADSEDDEAVAVAVRALQPPLPFTASSSTAVNLTGLWEKDMAASQVQEYESMLDVLELGGLQKVTARLIDGIDVQHDEERFEVGFVTVVPFFRVTEKCRFDGPSDMMRRDLRSGRQTAVAARIAGGVAVDMRWEAPLAGGLREEYVASADGDSLAVTSCIAVGERRVTAMQVYRRSRRSKQDFLASQRSSYGSLEDVLQSQEKTYSKVKF